MFFLLLGIGPWYREVLRCRVFDHVERVSRLCNTFLYYAACVNSFSYMLFVIQMNIYLFN